MLTDDACRALRAAWGMLALAIFLLATPALAAELTVTDGDTVRLGDERIRLEGIDAAEIHSPKCDAERRLAAITRDRLEEMLASGVVEFHRNGRDRYGRTLATVTVDGHDVGERLVREGYARVWRGRRESWCE